MREGGGLRFIKTRYCCYPPSAFLLFPPPPSTVTSISPVTPPEDSEEYLYVGEASWWFPDSVVTGAETHLSPAVSAAVAGGAVQPVAVVARPSRAHRAGRGVVRLAGGPPAVHGEEGVPDIAGATLGLRQLLSLGELVEAALDVEQLCAGLVSLHPHHGGVAAALQNNSQSTLKKGKLKRIII